MTSSSCDLTFNWDSQNQGCVTRYSFIDVEASDFENISLEERLNSSERACVTFHKKSQEENLVATIVCLTPELSQISGISIDSESRLLEISNNLEGYIKTIHGKRLSSESTTEENKDDQHNKFFVCSSSFEKPYVSLSVKFLSIGQKETLSIRSIKINLQQHSLDIKGANHNDAFDVAKLRKEVESMGDGVSDKALEFLKTMEIFEQNKVKSLERMTTGSPNMSHLFGMTNGSARGLPHIMKSVLGEQTMNHLLQDVSQSQSSDKQALEDSSIYSMLQAVCGSVAKTRQSIQEKDETLPNTSTVKQVVQVTEHPENGKGKVGDLLTEMFQQQLAEARQEMRAEVSAVKEELMAKMEGIRKELSDKLDTISNLLQTVVEQNGT